MPDTIIPAEVFHASQYVADEAMARGWSIWDFVERVGTLNAPLDVLAWRLYASSSQAEDVELRRCLGVGEHWTSDLQRVFGVDAEVWQRIHNLCQAHLDRIAPLSRDAYVWYYDEEPDESGSSPTPTPEKTTDPAGLHSEIERLRNG